MDSKIYKVSANTQKVIYSSDKQIKINYLSVVNTDAVASATIHIYIQEIGNYLDVELGRGTKVVITPNGLSLDAGSQYERENIILNGNQVLLIHSTKTADVYVGIWE